MIKKLPFIPKITQKWSKQSDAKSAFLVNQLHHHSPTLAKNLSLTLSGTVIASHSMMAGVPLFALGSIKLACQKTGLFSSFGKKADDGIIAIADNWIGINNWLIDHMLPVKDWRISLPKGIDKNKRYLLICNHQSWVDTSIIQYISQGKLPLTRFFAKHELLYIPVVGQAFYLLDFPMMKRHSKEKLAKNPHLVGQDLATARRACQSLADKPFVLLNYLEGTRFGAEKHANQNSPYRHLLKPKAGGFALAISSLGDKIDGILDMTIVYPDGVPEYDDLWAGKVGRLGVDIREVVLPDDLLNSLKQGKYAHDDATKQTLHDWLDILWQQKDDKIDELNQSFVNHD